MRLEELTPGTPITLMIEIKGQQLTFDTTIRDVYARRKLVLADAIYRDHKILAFHGSNIMVNILVTMEDDKPQLFKNVTVSIIKTKDGTLYYKLDASAESTTYNRRQSFRCYVGLSTSVRLGMNRVALPAIIRDVSNSGFAIVCDRDYGLDQNQIVHVVLNDNLEEISEEFNFQLYGLIARTQELENGKILYGCRLNNSLPKLDSYIMKKERLRLKRASGFM